MSGWYQKDKYVFFAYGKCGSTSLDHSGFERVVDDSDDLITGCLQINNYLDNKDLTPIVFIRDPLERFYSGMFQFMMRHCVNLNVKLTADEDCWINIWNSFLEITNFDRKAPVFNDSEAYHLNNYLEKYKKIKADITFIKTELLTPTLKDLVGVTVYRENSTASVYYKGAYRLGFNNSKYKDNVMAFLQPEIELYQKWI